MENKLASKFTNKDLIKFAMPTVMMMLFMSLYTVVDGIFVSRLVGSNALSAINISLPVLNLILAISIMFSTGGSAIIGKNMGEGFTEKAQKRFSLIILINLLLGILMSVLGYLFIDKIVVFLGASDALYQYTKDYLIILLIFAPINMLKINFDYFLVTSGKPDVSFFLTLLGGITNMVLDYIFIAPLNMGIRGAAFATAIGQLLPVIISLVIFFNKKNTLYLRKPELDFKMLFNSMANGSSEMVINLSAGITTLFFNSAMMYYLGENGVAAITVILYSQFLLTSIYIGFSSGVAPVISYKYGEKDTEQLKVIVRHSIQFICIVSVITFVLSYLISGNIISLFVEKIDPIYDITKNGFDIFAVGFLFTGLNIFASGMFTAFSDGKTSAIISFLRTFVFIIIGITILPKFFAVNGVWLTIPLAEILTIIISIFFIRKYKNKYCY